VSLFILVVYWQKTIPVGDFNVCLNAPTNLGLCRRGLSCKHETGETATLLGIVDVLMFEKYKYRNAFVG
jgi:hypothetical protein